MLLPDRHSAFLNVTPGTSLNEMCSGQTAQSVFFLANRPIKGRAESLDQIMAYNRLRNPLSLHHKMSGVRRSSQLIASQLRVWFGIDANTVTSFSDQSLWPWLCCSVIWRSYTLYPCSTRKKKNIFVEGQYCSGYQGLFSHVIAGLLSSQWSQWRVPLMACSFSSALVYQSTNSQWCTACLLVGSGFT